jgi:pyruvate dehydrogenase E1 component alpha subunit
LHIKNKVMTKQELIDFSDNIIRIYKEKNLRVTFHLSGGNEDQLLNVFKDIKEGDYVFSTHRNHYHALLHGIPAKELTEKIVEGRSMYIFDRNRNFFTSAIIGGMVAIAAGVALALKRKGSTQKVWCFVGDGTEDNGHLFEAARYVDGWDLPCTFILEDNNYSVSTSRKERWGTSVPPVLPKCVKRYHYDSKWPHIRVDGMLDFSKSKAPTNEELFPSLPLEPLPNFDHLLSENISFKNAVSKSMVNISNNNGVFIGYGVKNIKYGNAMGVLEPISDDLKIETPVAENLMAGLAMGMSFEGFRPVIYYERHDFMLVAADAIGNHMNHIERISHGEYKVPVIMRTIVTDGGLFYAGPTHSQNFTNVFKTLVDFPIYVPSTGGEVLKSYNLALASNRPSMIVEKKSLY